MKVIIAGGGTAGHINPGLAIAKSLKARYPGSEIIFVGTEKGLETRLIPREGFKLELITVRGFTRKLSLDLLRAVKELFQGFGEAKKIIKEFNPDIVIGTGGYVCGPVLYMASKLKIPTLVHEQNALPGVTNRILSRYADAVAISFKESEKFFKSARKLFLSGNPLREEILKVDRAFARKELGMDEGKPHIVIFGGSRGAGRINDAAVDMINSLGGREDIQITFATGEASYEEIKKRITGINPLIKTVPYIFDMGRVMASADLVVSRAGALTLSELTALGVPSVIIPSPNVTANHQEYNARSLEKQGAALVILEKDLDGASLLEKINTLIKDKNKLKNMAASAKKAGIRNSASLIMEEIERLIKSKR